MLTPWRIAIAFLVALATDAIQISLGPFGFLLVDEFLDVVAMVLTSFAIGFHPLLLPTFIIELIPVADLMPTWTGCTAAVVLLRRRAVRAAGGGSVQANAGSAASSPIAEVAGPPNASRQIAADSGAEAD